MGRRALIACDCARDLVAQLIGCSSDEIVFTSGATESNNMVLAGVTALATKRKKVVTTMVEHKSISEPCRALATGGFEVVQLPVDDNCVVDLGVAANAIDENTAIVSVQGANNEVGVLAPLKELAAMAHAKGALFHCDGAQLLSKVPVSCDDAGFEYASFSAHKAYGPKGVGILFVRKGTARAAIEPLLRGGGQEGALRPGTLNVPGIVGFGEACRLARQKLAEDGERIGGLRSSFEEAIARILPSVRINASHAERLPGTTSLTIPGIPATMLMANMPYLCIGDGSACNSGAPEPSHVLLAMGIPWEYAECTVRISFGRGNSPSDVDATVRSIARAAERILSLMPENSMPNPEYVGRVQL